jgi:cation:H+ antiporter
MGVDLLFLVLGGALLFYGGDWLVAGIERLAEGLRVPPVILAFVVMGFGTSAPELFVAVQAMLASAPDIAMGNVVGSNIANLLLVLAIAALIAPIAIDADVLRIDGGAMLAGAVVLGVVVADGVVSRIDAAMLFLGMLVYLGARWRTLEPTGDADGFQNGGWKGAAVWCGVALIALPTGAHLFIEGAIGVAHSLGASEALIGLTVVAVGTSLPEMASCFAAAMRRQSGIILGGILGSNVFNGTIVLGAAGLVAPVAVADEFVVFWIPVAIAASIASLVFLRTGFFLSRREAMIMLVGYAAIFAV